MPSRWITHLGTVNASALPEGPPAATFSGYSPDGRPMSEELPWPLPEDWELSLVHTYDKTRPRTLLTPGRVENCTISIGFARMKDIEAPPRSFKARTALGLCR